MKKVFYSIVISILIGICNHNFAWSDQIDSLVKILRTDPSYKVRLQVALTLSRMKGDRVVLALISALGDENYTVRGVAASGLGQIGDKRAVEPLEKLNELEKHHFVKAQIAKALKLLSDSGETKQISPKTRFWVRLGKIVNRTDRGGTELSQAFGEELLKYFQTVQSVVTDNGSKPLKESDLKKYGLKAFILDGSIVELTHLRRGDMVEISCKIKVTLATYPAYSLKAFYTGGASMEVLKNDLDKPIPLYRELIAGAAQGAKEHIVGSYLSSQ